MVVCPYVLTAADAQGIQTGLENIDWAASLFRYETQTCISTYALTSIVPAGILACDLLSSGARLGCHLVKLVN
jgi:hypothetical protein